MYNHLSWSPGYLHLTYILTNRRPCLYMCYAIINCLAGQHNDYYETLNSGSIRVYNQCHLKSHTGYLLSEGKRVAVAYHNLPDLHEEQKMKLVIRRSLRVFLSQYTKGDGFIIEIHRVKTAHHMTYSLNRKI